MEYKYKEVDFATYCPTCEHEDLEDLEEPCNECLSNPANLHSNKPVYWKEVKK